jgi:hypothetical protein
MSAEAVKGEAVIAAIVIDIYLIYLRTLASFD